NELDSIETSRIEPFLYGQGKSGLRFDEREHSLIIGLQTLVRHSHEHGEHLRLVLVVNLNDVTNTRRIKQTDHIWSVRLKHHTRNFKRSVYRKPRLKVPLITVNG